MDKNGNINKKLNRINIGRLQQNIKKNNDKKMIKNI